MMFNRGIIGKPNYIGIEKVASKVKWQQIQSAFGTKDSLDKVARKLVKRMLLSDDGKSMAVLYVDKYGAMFIEQYLKIHPTAVTDLEAKLAEK
jgi:hypothetical protein